MKIVHRQVNLDGPGIIKMIPEAEDDLWLAYKLIAKDDSVTTVTFRKVSRESPSELSSASKRIKLEIEVKVDSVEYNKKGSIIRVRGKNLTKNEHVKVERSHTLEIELKRPFALKKKSWDASALEALDQASSDTKSASADLAVVLIQEGLSHIFLVAKNDIKTCSHVKTSIPRKGRDHSPNSNAIYENALTKFFNETSQSFLANVDFGFVRCVVIAGPGNTKERFHRHLLSEAERENITSVIENRSCVILVHATSGNMNSLSEVLDNKSVMSQVTDVKAAKEVRALEDFFAMGLRDPQRTCYGPKHVEVAHERMAIQTLLITDELFRSCDVSTRERCADLVDSVKGFGGTVHVFSCEHESGRELAKWTGVAAILRFPLPDLDDVGM